MQEICIILLIDFLSWIDPQIPNSLKTENSVLLVIDEEEKKQNYT